MALMVIVSTLLMIAMLIIAIIIFLAIGGSEDEPIVDCGYAGFQKESVCKSWKDSCPLCGTPPKPTRSN